MRREQLVLKAVLLLRKVGNKSTTKEEQLQDVKDWFVEGYMTDDSLQEWVNELKNELAKTPEQLEAECEERLEELMEFDAEQARREMEDIYEEKSYCPSNPWDAPGMSVIDFI